MKFIVISRCELIQAVQKFCDVRFTDKVKVTMVCAFSNDIPLSTAQILPETYMVSFEQEEEKP